MSKAGARRSWSLAAAGLALLTASVVMMAAGAQPSRAQTAPAGGLDLGRIGMFGVSGGRFLEHRGGQLLNGPPALPGYHVRPVSPGPVGCSLPTVPAGPD